MTGERAIMPPLLVSLLANPKDLLKDPQELLPVLPYMLYEQPEPDRHPIYNWLNVDFRRFGPVIDPLGFRTYWYTTGTVFFSLTFDLQVRGVGYSIYLNHIYSLDRRQGYAGECLRRICDLSDLNKVAIFLHADPEADKPVDVLRLRYWYEKHGFVFDLVDLPGGLNGAMRLPGR